MQRVRGFILVVSIGLLVPSVAFGWAGEGHRIVALIAARELTPAARASVQSLLGPGDVASVMANASVWADSIKRQRPETRPWHYVDIEIETRGYERARDCPGDDCIVEQIHHEIRILRDRQLLSPVRAEALRFLIHFIGDLHQPLHCADHHDRGGNEIRIVLRRHHTNLHAIWDGDVVRALGRNPSRVAAALIDQMNRQDISHWQRGTIENWATETFSVAKQNVYPDFAGGSSTNGFIVLSPDYPARQRILVQRQLEKAGARLAIILNQVFASSGPGH